MRRGRPLCALFGFALIVFGVLILVLLIRPTGILGRQIQEKV